MEDFKLEMVNSTTDMLVASVLTPTSIERIKEAQNSNTKLVKIKEIVKVEPFDGFELKNDGSLWMRGRLCVSRDEELKQQVLKEAHNSRLSIHPGEAKIYRLEKKFLVEQTEARDS